MARPLAHSRNKKRRFKHTDGSVGVIRISRRGYGFVATPEGEYFIPRGNIYGAMDGDVVQVVRMRRLEERRRSQTKNAGEGRRDMLGSVKRVIERAHTTVVGMLHYRDGLGVVTPSDARICHDIFIDPRAIGVPAVDGDVVEVRLTTYPSRLEAAQGYIEEVVGHHDERGMDIELIIRRHKLETAFSAAALEEAARLAESAMQAALQSVAAVDGGDSPTATATALATAAAAPIAVTDIGATPVDESLPRRDLRERFIFTIDPSDARDFDDALSVDFIEGQMLVGVHIADVSAYVAWESSVDLDARRRATSVYLPDRVLPMLPPQLSDDLCSLKPNEDRLAFTCDMLMRSDGTVQSYELYPSLIRSRARLSYDEVQAFFDDNEASSESLSQVESRIQAETLVQTQPCVPTASAIREDLRLQNRLRVLNRLAKKLVRRREARGAIDFESIEAKVSLDESGKPVAVTLREKTDATSLVEEAMILTNEVVANHMLTHQAAMVYRIHEEPFQAALEQLLPTLQE
ncbi:MAG: RNB domain-containing ribonuclease, partial [Coriobacteriaceae bacterium]|nr:RNB domain-containing ribonuclease [Coriobacteriaceae bacterium]